MEQSPGRDSDPRVMTVLSKAQELIEQHHARLVAIVSPGLEAEETVDHMAQTALNTLGLPAKRMSSIKLAIHTIVHELLPPKELKQRRLRVNKANMKRAHLPGVTDYSEYGHLGGLARIAKGGIPSGDAPWSEAELQTLWELTQDPENRHQSGAHAGNLYATKIHALFCDRPGYDRSLNAVKLALTPNRKKTKKLWQRIGKAPPA